MEEINYKKDEIEIKIKILNKMLYEFTNDLDNVRTHGNKILVSDFINWGLDDLIAVNRRTRILVDNVIKHELNTCKIIGEKSIDSSLKFTLALFKDTKEKGSEYILTCCYSNSQKSINIKNSDLIARFNDLSKEEMLEFEEINSLYRDLTQNSNDNH